MATKTIPYHNKSGSSSGGESKTTVVLPTSQDFVNATWQHELDRDIEIVCKIKTICSSFSHIGFNHAANVETSLEHELFVFLCHH